MAEVAVWSRTRSTCCWLLLDGRRPKDRKYFVRTLDTTAGPAATPTQVIEDRNPSWSPNDQKLLFTSENGKLQIVTLGTGAIRTVSTSNGIQEDWRR